MKRKLSLLPPAPARSPLVARPSKRLKQWLPSVLNESEGKEDADSTQGNSSAAIAASYTGTERGAQSVAGETVNDHKQVCKMCLRNDKEENPMPTKFPGPRLQFPQDRLMRCRGCIMWLRSDCANMTSAQLLEEIEKDDEKRADLKRCVMEMEMQVESSLSRKHFAKMRAPSWANLLNETGLEDRVNLGVFWPRQVWLANEPTKSFPEALKQKYKGIVGVWRDKKHGEPPNSISSFQVEAMKTQYVKQLASSSTNMKGTVREVAKELGASLTGFKAELKTDAEGESSVAFVDAGALDINKAIQKKRALKEQGSTSDEDWHACMPQHSVQKAEKKKRESNSSEGSSGSSRRRAQTNKSRKKEDRPRGRREQ